MSTTPNLRSNRRGSTRRARARADLVAAARVVIVRDGIAALTVDAVAAVADVSKPSVYYYFESKDHLVRCLAVELSRDEQGAVQRAVADAAAGPQVLGVLVTAYVRHHLDSLELFKTQYLWSQVVGLVDLDLDLDVNAGMNHLFDVVEQQLRAAQDAGQLRQGVHPRRLAVAAWTAAHGFVSTLALLDSGGTALLHDVDALLQELCDTLVQGAAQQDDAAAAEHPADHRAGPP